MHSLADSQLLDQLARTLMAAAVYSGSSNAPDVAVEAAPPTTAAAPAFASHQQRCGRAAPASAPDGMQRVHGQPSLWSSSLQDNAARLDYALAMAVVAVETAAGSIAGDTCTDPGAATLRFLDRGQYTSPLVRNVLGAPGLQYYVAARMVQTLCAVDGGPSWGMSQVPLPLPDMSAWTHPDGRPTRDARCMAFAETAARVLMAGLAQHQRRPQPAARQQQQQRGSGGVPVQPVQPGGAFRIALRSLEWALKQAPGSGAAAGPHRTCRMNRSALRVVWGMLEVAMVALHVGAPAKVAARLQQLLPLAVAALAGACEEDTALNEAEVRLVFKLVVRVLLSAVLDPHDANICSWRGETAMACMPAALGSGLLPALQAAAAWLTPERIAADNRTHPDTCVALLFLYVRGGMPDWLRLGAPEAAAVQPAALVASMRSTFMGAFSIVLGGNVAIRNPHAIAFTRLGSELYTGLMQLLHASDATGSATLLAIAAFALVQWGPCLQRAAMMMIGVQARALRSLRGSSSMWLSALAPIAVAATACALFAAELGASEADAGDPGAAVPASASAAAACHASRAARLASWRRLLLRDLRALDTLGLVWRIMEAYEGFSDQDLVLMLVALQAVARALPDDLQRHLESARGQPETRGLQDVIDLYLCARSGHSSMPSAQPSGCGLAWLRLGEQAVPALAEGRFDDLELPGGRKSPARTGAQLEVLRSFAEKAAACLPAPCEVAVVLPTCDNPLCTAQACYLAAGRGGPMPALRPCTKCGQARYCSTKCRKAHWDAYHGAECGKGWWEPQG